MFSFVFCTNCAKRVNDAAGRSRIPFARYCPKCGAPAERTGEVFIIFGLAIGVFGNMILCDEAPIFGDIFGGALIAFGVTRFLRHSLTLPHTVESKDK